MKLTYRGKTYFINEDLLKRQKVSDDNIQKILKHYYQIDMLFEECETMDVYIPDDVEYLKNRAKELEQIEFSLQEAWNFTQDRDFHSYWWRIPHCTCPEMDNRERVGTGMFIIDGDCPIHGK